MGCGDIAVILTNLGVANALPYIISCDSIELTTLKAYFSYSMNKKMPSLPGAPKDVLEFASER